MSAPLVAWPLGEEKEKGTRDSLSKKQERRVPENGGNSSQKQRGAVAHIKDWDDLLHEQISQQSGEAPKQGREGTLEQLAQAAQQAYARGDGNHPDWDRVAGLIEDLRPENGEEHAKRRLSVGDAADEAQEAEAEELQLHFFCATLPAIKKTSVVAALRGLNNFKTAAIIEKANEERSAWEGAKASFEEACKTYELHPDDGLNNPTSDQGDADFYSPGPFEAYLQKLNYKINRSEIENQLDALHHEIIQGIINANVTTEDFEKRALNAQEIAARYQPLFGMIAEAKEIADPAVQHKWEQFHQEAAARYLEDLSQVAKIKLWQNRNQVTSINKTAERAHERAERAERAADVGVWQMALEQGEAAKDAWIERSNQLAVARENIEAHKKMVSLKISPAIEKEIEGALNKAKERVSFWSASLLSMECFKKYNEALSIRREKTILQKEIDQFPALLKKAVFDDPDSHEYLCQHNKSSKEKLERLTNACIVLFAATNANCKTAISALVQEKENISVEQKGPWESRLETFLRLEQLDQALLRLEQLELEIRFNTPFQKPRADD
ncbi:MAG: hypothetical protein K2W97_05535 [Chthoniobacterales bacterium]|nr:hypothetical protein [Chthoniobacterales bacterium]